MSAAIAEFDVAIVGGGPAGQTAAIAIAEAGFRTVLFAPETPPDHRTTALLGGSVTLLEKLGLIDAVAECGATMHTMRLIDDTGRLIRAPEVNFRCQEIGRDVFGYNIHNRDLNRILQERSLGLTNLTRVSARVEASHVDEGSITVQTTGGDRFSAQIAVAADGARSYLREAAGIQLKSWSYPQSALVLDVTHTRPHGGVSVEFHTKAGPFVLVPLPGNSSSIVLVETPEIADNLHAMNDTTLAREIERRAHSILGKFTIASPRQVFPLSGFTADVMAQNRVALIGEAGHRFPPIGAQGLNLSFRDVGALTECLVNARRKQGDLGSDTTLNAYIKARRIDITTRTAGVDIMDRALLADNLPAQALRSLGLFLADRITPLRHLMMREGLAPTIGTPNMMRSQGR